MSVTVIVTLGIVALQLIVIFGFVLLERRQPVATLAWILAVMLIPVLGVVLYLLFGLRNNLKRRDEALRIERRVESVLDRWQVARKRIGAPGAPQLSPAAATMARLGERASNARTCYANAAASLVNAEATYRAMVDCFVSATDHLHVQFYIIQPDQTGIAMRDQLVRKATEGVQVRVLADAVGSMRLPSDFWRPLTKAGGHAAYFAPVRLAPRFRRRDRINYRNHRKIIVADGRVGLTGGINVGREYLGLDPAIGHWRDTHVRIEGPAVLGLQETFVEDWLAATGELLDAERYFPVQATEPAGDAVVQIVASGPDRTWSGLHQIYFQAIALARQRVWVTSPYFVPDRVIQAALVTAALRDVDVRLLVPKRSDSRLIDYASRAYFAELLEAGVRIYEYARGFVHAKTLVVDDWLGSVGSANMDVRSFHINYELSAFVYDGTFTGDLADQFEHDLESAAQVPTDWASRLSYTKRVLHATAGLLSPLL